MPTVLKNVLQFRGLVVGVPVAIPHLLNDKGRALVPQWVAATVGPYAVVLDSTNVTLTRTAASPGPDVDVWVEFFHSYESVFPVGPLPAGIPFVLQPDGTGGPPSGPAGGDLDGNYPAPTIHRPRTTFVFRPGEPAPGANVYNDITLLLAARAAVAGPAAISFDDTLVTPIVFPPGVYDMAETSWVGGPAAGFAAPEIVVDDGVTFTNFVSADALVIQGDSASGPSITGGSLPMRFTRCSLSAGFAAGTDPLIQGTVELVDTAVFAAVPVIDVSSTTAALFGTTTIGQNVLAAVGGFGGATLNIGSRAVEIASQSVSWTATMTVVPLINPGWMTELGAGPVLAHGKVSVFTVATIVSTRVLPASQRERAGLDVVVVNRTTNSLFLAPTGADTISGNRTVPPNSMRRYIDLGTGAWQESGTSEPRKQVAQTNNAALTILTDDGLAAAAENVQLIPNDSTVIVEARVSGRRLAPIENFCVILRAAVQKAGAGTTAIAGTVAPVVLVQDAAAGAWTATLIADAALDAVEIQVSGEVGKTLQWSSSIQVMENRL